MAEVTICSDFEAQENKICHCFHCFPIYLPWSDGTWCHDVCFLNVEFWVLNVENFEHYFASMWDERNCVVVWIFFGIEMKTDLLQSCGHCWVFHTCWHIECSTLTASSFRMPSLSDPSSPPWPRPCPMMSPIWKWGWKVFHFADFPVNTDKGHMGRAALPSESQTWAIM